ncbi:hypothetical protein [Coxiella-like endosymbiont of Rhipicephalus sanguineus]|nr:hypothetical protein [Coxiella-like endosymbiont of Rhipicephalus sanguineus]
MPTLIFDEADTGVGSKTAEIVDRFLRKLGEKLKCYALLIYPK